MGKLLLDEQDRLFFGFGMSESRIFRLYIIAKKHGFRVTIINQEGGQNDESY